MKENLTIVIPCKNEGLTIKRCLSHLNKQEGIKGTRIIISDSSNDDGYTRKCILSECDKNTQIEIVKGGFPSIARNNGAKLATTKYILFLDADMFIDNENLLTILLAKMKGKDLLTTRIRTTDGSYDHIYKIFDLIQFFIKFSTPFAVGGFMLFSKEAFDRLGGFNPEDKFAEDYHLSSRISPEKFYIDNHAVYTLPRRFKNKGVRYMSNLMLKTYLHKNDDEFFKKEYGYWT
jgi:glycosyltransferase involved in cell wall biosynthesis